jgi:general secretion pathway protein K
MRMLQHGTAVVMAMLIVAVSAALVSGTFLRQSAMARQVENEIAMNQGWRLLDGAVDWVRVILREDARTSAIDHLGEPWAVSLEQTRLDNESGDSAWISGAIEDAQARFNLRNVSGLTGLVPREVATLRRLMEIVNADPGLAEAIALRVHRAISIQPGQATRQRVIPATLDDLVVDDPAERAALARLRPFVVLLPFPSQVNANTAPAEVLAAYVKNLSLVDARGLVKSRDRAAFKDAQDLSSRLPERDSTRDLGALAVATEFFLVRGFVEFRRVRVQALALLWRHGGKVETVWSRQEAT